MSRRLLPAAAFSLLAAWAVPMAPAGAQIPPEWASWNERVEPFRIAGNLYYVGAREVAAYLFETADGLILLDAGFEETVPVITAAIEELGFRLEDVEVLITSHAHFDHVGGLSELERLTGATLVASAAEAPLLESGGVEYPFTPVAVDRVVEDGEAVELGGTRLTAMVTAGHTPGCTTWTAAVPGTDLEALFLCSVNVLPGMDLVTPDEAFPEGRAAAFVRSFERLEAATPDLFLGSHGSFFHLLDKVELLAGDHDANPFIDPALFREHIAERRRRFQAALAAQLDEDGSSR